MTVAASHVAQGAARVDAGGRGPLLVVIAATVEERLQLIARIGPAGPVLLAASAEEAAQILQGSPREAPTGPVRDRVAHPSGGAALGLSLVPDRQVARHGSHEVGLTPLEFGLLRCLVAETGRVRSFADLSRQVWGTSHVGDASQIHAVVKRLRRKLADLCVPARVEAIRGIGFRLVATRPLQPVTDSR